MTNKDKWQKTTDYKQKQMLNNNKEQTLINDKLKQHQTTNKEERQQWKTTN